MWTSLALVALGGAAGSVTRYLGVIAAARVLGAGFPVGVMAINVVGSFAIGVLAVHLTGPRAAMSPLLVSGFLGGFTTFSAFSLDALRLWEAGQPGAAAAYVAGSVGLSLLGVVLGAILGRALL
jgi:fluoride exporter